MSSAPVSSSSLVFSNSSWSRLPFHSVQAFFDEARMSTTVSR
jgi:hypothetical protein